MKKTGAGAGFLWGLLAIVLLLAGACDPGAPPSPDAASSPGVAPPAFPLSITGSNGQEVILSRPPERIVVFDGASVEILFALGEGRRVVGTHDFVTYPPEVERIPKLGGAFAVDFERMAALDPELIYTFFDRFLPGMEQLVAPVLYLESPRTLDEVTGRMRTWGVIVGRPAAGEALAAQFERSLEAVLEKLKAVEDGPRLYHDAAPGLWTAGAGSLADEIYTLLKARNVFPEISDSAQVSPEAIVVRDPEVIVSMHPDGPALFRSEPALQDVSAVRNDRILRIDGSLLGTPGPRLVQAVEDVGRFLYPELFPSGGSRP